MDTNWEDLYVTSICKVNNKTVLASTNDGELFLIAYPSLRHITHEPSFYFSIYEVKKITPSKNEFIFTNPKGISFIKI